MLQIKDTQRALVCRCGNGAYQKSFRLESALERFDNEIRVLRHLEAVDCPFVPRLLDSCRDRRTILVTNCGSPVRELPQSKIDSLFQELEEYGVRHLDRELRNILYDPHRGRFCVIDFELAEITSDPIRPRSAVIASAEKTVLDVESLMSELK